MTRANNLLLIMSLAHDITRDFPRIITLNNRLLFERFVRDIVDETNVF